MKFNRPLIILLGGILAASGAGCSAASALLTESRPASAVRQNSADRMVAIGQVFEKQGRLEQAEAMYRGALRKNPKDASIRNQLASVQALRKPVVGPASVGTALAARTPTPAPTTTGQPKLKNVSSGSVSGQPVGVKKASETTSTAVAPVTASDKKPQTVVSALPTTTGLVKAQPVSAVAATEIVPVTHPGSAVPAITASRTEPRSITLEDVLLAADTPENHFDLLVDAMTLGDQIETQCLAATLLGECSPQNEKVRTALSKTAETASDTGLLLAVTDSQLQRGELNSASAGKLTSLLSGADPAMQIQVATMLRHFAGRDSQASCVKALETLLSSGDQDVRATAVLTLGDFGQPDAHIRDRLTVMAEDDASASVREAAAATLSRWATVVK